VLSIGLQKKSDILATGGQTRPSTKTSTDHNFHSFNCFQKCIRIQQPKERKKERKKEELENNNNKNNKTKKKGRKTQSIISRTNKFIQPSIVKQADNR